jgi:hypothetical protein
VIDRAIGVAGIALGVIFGILQYYLPKLPAWLSASGMGVGVFLLGLSVGLVASGGRKKPIAATPADRAKLRLHVYADHRVPDNLFAENIFRWYYLRQALVTINANGEQASTYLSTTLFVGFEPEVRISSLKVRSPDIALPPHEVKEFNQRFAIIVFGGQVGEGTLEFEVQP